MNNINDLIKKAKKIYQDNFKPETWFERAIFFSWWCGIGDCKFCFMSTQKIDENFKKRRRSKESIYAEAFICKEYGWPLGFFTGGVGAYSHEDLLDIIKNLNKILGYKFWISLGPIPKERLIDYAPYIRGVVGSIETINPVLHKEVCPSKPIEPYEKMFENAKELGLDRAMTFIVGMGETRNDFTLLKAFIKKYGIIKIHVYGLNPHKGTFFENTKPPGKEDQAWWIAKLRIAFPTLDIQLGIWLDRIKYISYLLEAGANSISKFPITSRFGTKVAKDIEAQAKIAKREFKGTLTKVKTVNWQKTIDDSGIEKDRQAGVLEKIKLYEKRFKKNSKK